MVQDAPARDLLRTAGDFFAVHGDIAGAVFLRRNAERVQRPDDRLQTAVVVERPRLVGYERIVEVPKVMIDRPAARHPAHDGNTPVQKRTHMHLPADILIAPDDDSRPVAPQQQHIALTVGAEHIVLKRLIKIRVMRCCFDLNHAEILPFLISFFILSQVSTKNNRKLRARTESLPHRRRWPEGPGNSFNFWKS